MQMQTEEITCPFDGVPGEFRFSQEGWSALTCPKCRLMFISPRPTPEAVASIYELDAAHAGSMVHLRHFGTSVNNLAAGRAVKLIQKYKKGGRVLEIGPGSGAFLDAAKKAGFDVAGVELNPVQAEHIRSLGISCWSSLDEIEGTFDVVYHCDVASHLYDPVATFRQIGEMLNPGGLHIFETGEGDIDPKFWHLIPNWQLPDHLFTFSGPSLRLLLQESGYEPLEITRYSTAFIMRVKGAIDRARGRVYPPVDLEPSVSTKTFVPIDASAAKRRSRKEQLMVNAFSYPWHFMRYVLGKYLPRRGRPQTVITVARKVG